MSNVYDSMTLAISELYYAKSGVSRLCLPKIVLNQVTGPCMFTKRMPSKDYKIKLTNVNRSHGDKVGGE